MLWYLITLSILTNYYLIVSDIYNNLEWLIKIIYGLTLIMP